MRATPAQIALRLICGHEMNQVRNLSFRARIKEGRASLVSITGEDFGFDLQAWHDHLKNSRQGGYTYGRNIKLPRIMQEALASETWKNTVATIENQQRKSLH